MASAIPNNRNHDGSANKERGPGSPRTPTPDDGIFSSIMDENIIAKDSFFPYNEEKTMQSVWRWNATTIFLHD